MSGSTWLKLAPSHVTTSRPKGTLERLSVGSKATSTDGSSLYPMSCLFVSRLDCRQGIGYGIPWYVYDFILRAGVSARYLMEILTSAFHPSDPIHLHPL
eukprot:8945048-Pyramimonas_sp.AAC.1